MVSTSRQPGDGVLGAVLSRRWTLVRKLGEGGMGEVYAAEPVGAGPRVAVKILRRDYLGDPEVRSRFLEEGRTCTRLVHPNIVRVIECAQAEDGSPYIAMELLEGVPLSAYMQGGARISVAQATPILQSVLAGLAAAHSSGIVHRDLKPDNVFLNRDSAGAFIVKILDFGIAKVMDVAGGMGNRTRTGMLLGTPAYMSPEQARSARDVDQRADLWSAGVLLYEMLTGRPAFPAPTEYARLAAVLSSEPEPVERIDASLAPLSSFFERALKKNREERFVTAAEMGSALGAATSTARSSASQSAELAAPRAPGRIPEVALGVPPLAPEAGGPTRRSQAPSGRASSPSGAPTAEGGRFDESPGAGRGGTLASPAGPRGAARQSAAPHVAIAPSGAAHSKGAVGFGLSSRGRAVPIGIVVVLVVCALLGGLLLGWSIGRTA
ncbi:MAG TPA: protein kinase [Polyangiaceae bacterium]|nr:protein kinase [Polyangiaceae bacterium]